MVLNPGHRLSVCLRAADLRTTQVCATKGTYGTDLLTLSSVSALSSRRATAWPASSHAGRCQAKPSTLQPFPPHSRPEETHLHHLAFRGSTLVRVFKASSSATRSSFRPGSALELRPTSPVEAGLRACEIAGRAPNPPGCVASSGPNSKVGPILPVPLAIYQPQIGFVDQRGCLACEPPLSTHVSDGPGA